MVIIFPVEILFFPIFFVVGNPMKRSVHFISGDPMRRSFSLPLFFRSACYVVKVASMIPAAAAGYIFSFCQLSSYIFVGGSL